MKIERLKVIQLQFKNKLNRDYAIFSGFLGMAFIFRLFLMRYHFAIGWDEPHYLQLAVLFSKGQFLQALHPYWSPLYSVFVAAVSFIIPDFELAGRIVSLMCGILIFIPVFFFTKKLFGKRSGYWAIGLLTFYSPLAFSTTTALAEPTFIFLSIIAIYFGWKAIENKSLKYSIFTGIFFGFSYLTKPEGIGYFFIFIIFSGIYAIIDFIQSQRRRLFIVILSGVSFVFISAPYILYLHNETGRWTISSK
ncbi:glycosyltransferase family 39 protein, partial [bacterium]|nr:glycosyltransferase family 39 protein [bacterium]